MTSILIVTGEESGERCGAGLVREFKKTHPEVRFFGIGGDAMENAGVERLYTLRDLALIGIVEVLAHIPRLRRIKRHLLQEARERKPVAAVLIDSPDFNLRLARDLKRLSIPILYYISPTIWAWRRRRLHSIKRFVDKMLLIFPFEKDIYDRHGIPAEYVGHPLLERLPPRIDGKAFRTKHKLDSSRPLIALLPGSRPSEIKYHMPTLMQAMKDIIRDHGAQGILLVAENLDVDFISEFVPLELSDDVRLLKKERYAALYSADAALSSCGTANLETAVLDTPMVAFYRVSPLTYLVGKPLVRLRHYSIVNILCGDRPIIPELIQKDFTAANLRREADRILTSEEARTVMSGHFKEIRDSLGSRRSSIEAARQLSQLLDRKD